jgi:RimJ/RimL family protein N-acetyltransferase
MALLVGKGEIRSLVARKHGHCNVLAEVVIPAPAFGVHERARRATIGAMAAHRRAGDEPRIVELRLFTLERAKHTAEGSREESDDWAEDFPADGDREAAVALVRETAEGRPPGEFGPYEVIEVASGNVVGGIGFHAPPDRNGSVEVGYGIVESVAGRGYATLALIGFLELAGRLSVRDVRGRAVPENTASRRVMEKAGFTFEGITDGYACYRIVLPRRRAARHLAKGDGG